MLLRDLSLFGQGVYLQVPRRQFICPHCGKYPTEPLNFIDKRRNYTKRYEEYIYEKVKELTVEKVSKFSSRCRKLRYFCQTIKG
nr:helix-turn-helix domain-containing protein [Gloeothece citriformis]